MTTTRQKLKRKYPIGAELQPEGGVHFRVWAPKCQHVKVVLENDQFKHNGSGSSFDLSPESEGYFSGFIQEASAGTLYRFQLNADPMLYPDPASRFQPQGPHGPSQVIDPNAFRWNDQNWKGVPAEGRVVYEMHIGTFTHQGTWEGAKRELLELAEIGVNVIEMMPVAEFPGCFGWGYDGVDLFAPESIYGEPDDLKSFIDHAHAIGIAVILDVVYNHFGPDGCYLKPFSEDYFSKTYQTEWGEAINFDDANSKPVREFFITNATYWIEEYHFDGLRFDATQNIYDRTEPHILFEITQAVRNAVPYRQLYLVAENECQNSKIMTPAQHEGYGLDASWNDDFHHTALVRLTGRSEAYYTDYRGTPQEFISALKYGFLYQGQWYVWQNKNRGRSCFHLEPSSFVTFIENHDQVANSAHGLRIHRLTDPGNYRAMTALFLLSPNTPMLFQGQEFASSAPFYYFADHEEDLSKLVFEGRRDYFKQFPSIAVPEIQALLPNPSDPATFQACKLNFAERQKHGKEYALHRDLLRLRRNDPVFNTPVAN
jgi:maltooligosyltrehalose trehalohydrolase